MKKDADQRTCPSCEGIGRLRSGLDCPACRGTGKRDARRDAANKRQGRHG